MDEAIPAAVIGFASFGLCMIVSVRQAGRQAGDWVVVLDYIITSNKQNTHTHKHNTNAIGTLVVFVVIIIIIIIACYVFDGEASRRDRLTFNLLAASID